MTTWFKDVGKVNFPTYTGISVNMMPFIFGDKGSLPQELHPYTALLKPCDFEVGSICYLTVHESFVKAGTSQRRPGVHTEGFGTFSWGGGGWGGGVPKPKQETPKKLGLYMASTDGACRVWNSAALHSDNMGGITAPEGEPTDMDPSTLYWMTDRTPHEALVSTRTGPRQFFRVVSSHIDVWWAKHSTANPLGVQPTCHVDHRDKFSL